MKNKQTKEQHFNNNLWMVTGLLSLLAILLVLGFWEGNKQAAGVEADMRERLLCHATDIARTINYDQIGRASCRERV